MARIVLAAPSGRDVVINRYSGLDHALEDFFFANREACSVAGLWLEDLLRTRLRHVNHQPNAPLDSGVRCAVMWATKDEAGRTE